MKWMISFLFCLTASAQLPVFPYVVPNSAPTLPVPGAKYWWVSSDLPLNVNVTNWVDRISGKSWTNGADSLRPSNTSQGVFFTGTTKLPFTWLTNNLDVVVSNKTSLMMILRPYNTNSTGSSWHWFVTVNDADSYGADGGGRLNHNANLLYILNTNNMVDFLVCVKDVDSGVPFNAFTNGISTGNGSAFSGTGTQFNGLNGNPNTGNFARGPFQLLELIWWTNNIVTNATWVAAMHNYATNTYHIITP